VTADADRPLAARLAEVRAKVGAAQLDDDDLLLLAFEEISRTTTYEERAYGAGRPCTPSS